MPLAKSFSRAEGAKSRSDWGEERMADEDTERGYIRNSHYEREEREK